MKFLIVGLLALASSSDALRPFASHGYAYGGIQTESSSADEITSLPGLEVGINFKQYSGYLTVDEKHERNIFYWFVESQQSPAEDPVLLWTNGGPGCSGLIGFMTENGPFRPTKDGASLDLNPFAWNKFANVLFVEQPAGVGFSYSNDESDYTTGDLKAANDNYLAVLQWLKKFPQFQASKFYITSESYGGHYLPTLAKRIVEGNRASSAEDHINFGGLMVGNPYNYPKENSLGMFGTFWGHQLLPKMLYEKWSAKCLNAEVRDSSCDDLENQMQMTVGDLNPYSLDTPVCHDEVLRAGRTQRAFLLNKVHKQSDVLSKYEPCESNWAEAYLNRADVQQAIHARSGKWEECNMLINLKWNATDLEVHMEPIYQFLVDAPEKLHILVYSGDDDSVCGTMGTQSWIWDLGYETNDLWTPWTVDDQVAGYATEFNVSSGGAFHFVTVHSAGHEVPAYQPARALALLGNFLSGNFLGHRNQ